MKMTRKINPLFFLSLFFVLACSNDDSTIGNGPIAEPPIAQPPILNPPEPPTVSEDIEILNASLIHDGYVLINDVGRNRVYLMDKNGSVVHEWPLGNRQLAMDANLLKDGTLLIGLKSETQFITSGGAAGTIQRLDKNGTILWNFNYSTENHITHHDVELLPNGNIMALTWERLPESDAKAIGSKFDFDIFTEAIIEINPETNEIVWEWNAKDHLIQDFDPAKGNFGTISENPQLIDINYADLNPDPVMHSNGFSYDMDNDIVYLSVNNVGEVWVIDHSTSKAESATHSGGNFNKGGDLVYRFGNPSVSKASGEKLFQKNNHHPNFLGNGKMLIFSNGDLLDKSTVLELSLPAELDSKISPTVTPAITWSFENPSLHAPKASGAVRLPNGNTLITENDFGVWEVTPAKEVVWKYTQPGFIWRTYAFSKDADEIKALQLD